MQRVLPNTFGQHSSVRVKKRCIEIDASFLLIESPISLLSVCLEALDGFQQHLLHTAQAACDIHPLTNALYTP